VSGWGRIHGFEGREPGQRNVDRSNPVSGRPRAGLCPRILRGREVLRMIKWRYTWVRLLYVAMTVAALAIAAGAGNRWG